MSTFVKVISGTYRNAAIVDTVFPLVKPAKQGAKGMFLTVDATGILEDRQQIRIKVACTADFEYIDSEGSVVSAPVVEATGATVTPTISRPAETKEEAKDRVRKRFDTLDQLGNAVADQQVRGLIVSGPPGVGKSFGIENMLDTYEAEQKLMPGRTPDCRVVKGSMTPIGLYQALYMHREKGDILVFDDCDSILFDEICLNMLKAVLDSGKKRVISWAAESSVLRREDIPDRFEFQGGVIFITNVNFEHCRSKKIQAHLEALMSRCHYLDLEMDSVADRFIRIDQIVEDGMLAEYNFSKEHEAEIVDFMRENAARMREVSLRMVLKVADMRKLSEENWKTLTEATCMKRFA